VETTEQQLSAVCCLFHDFFLLHSLHSEIKLDADECGLFQGTIPTLACRYSGTRRSTDRYSNFGPLEYKSGV